MNECRFNKGELRIMIREILREELDHFRFVQRSDDTGRRIEELTKQLQDEATKRNEMPEVARRA